MKCLAVLMIKPWILKTEEGIQVVIQELSKASNSGSPKFRRRHEATCRLFFAGNNPLPQNNYTN